MTREIITKKKEQYQEFNKQVFEMIGNVFKELIKHFIIEEQRLKLLAGRK